MRMEKKIEGVVRKPLKKIPDKRGCVYRMPRCIDPNEIKRTSLFKDKIPYSWALRNG